MLSCLFCKESQEVSPFQIKATINISYKILITGQTTIGPFSIMRYTQTLFKNCLFYYCSMYMQITIDANRMKIQKYYNRKHVCHGNIAT